MTDYCKAQYMSCMDNFCNVLDENQGRCSCSKNLKNYAKTEEALEDATERVQEIMQKIQYIGLSTEQIETIFSQTEAEMALQGRKDNTEIQRDLERTKNMLVDIKTGTASSTTIDTGVNFDLSGLLNFDLASAGTFDLSSMLGSSNIGSTNTSSISNQRGEQLYKTAAARCKTAVLADCQNHGVDISIITNSYDMEIDKACITYEKNLVAANNQMKKDATNLSSFLQRARLALATQKNAYDLRECVTALDSCMQGDFVCGSDYESCLDPTGKYIVNGEIVVGSTPGTADTANTGLYDIWNSADTTPVNPWVGDDTLSEYIEETITNNISDISNTSKSQRTMTTYLMNKIGYHKEDKDFGMCMYVLNQCQNYTYDAKKNEYLVDNPVIREYLHRTLVNIKTSQDNKIAEYAEECISDIVTCLDNNNFDLNQINSRAGQIAMNACKAQITTCMSVTNITGDDGNPLDRSNWVIAVMNDPTNIPDSDNNNNQTGGSGEGGNGNEGTQGGTGGNTGGTGEGGNSNEGTQGGTGGNTDGNGEGGNGNEDTTNPPTCNSDTQILSNGQCVTYENFCNSTTNAHVASSGALCIITGLNEQECITATNNANGHLLKHEDSPTLYGNIQMISSTPHCFYILHNKYIEKQNECTNLGGTLTETNTDCKITNKTETECTNLGGTFRTSTCTITMFNSGNTTEPLLYTANDITGECNYDMTINSSGYCRCQTNFAIDDDTDTCTASGATKDCKTSDGTAGKQTFEIDPPWLFGEWSECTATQPCDIENGTGEETFTNGEWGTCMVKTCNEGYAPYENTCVKEGAKQDCDIENGTGEETFTNGNWGTCMVKTCNDGYAPYENTCVKEGAKQDCDIKNGTGTQTFTNGNWGTCTVKTCDDGYTVAGNICRDDAVITLCGNTGGTWDYTSHKCTNCPTYLYNNLDLYCSYYEKNDKADKKIDISNVLSNYCSSLQTQSDCEDAKTKSTDVCYNKQARGIYPLGATPDVQLCIWDPTYGCSRRHEYTTDFCPVDGETRNCTTENGTGEQTFTFDTTDATANQYIINEWGTWGNWSECTLKE
ncbi:MAG: hypothetical protein IKW67_03345 [Alphaproteobacteria bacterium]|nr:hypothetical protein [Alphaproteobacteria bacterium]